MIIKEVHVKTILSKSKVFDYTTNPYVGCIHGCTYCYARFIKRFTNHQEPWGKFVDVKINAPELLKKEIKKKRKGKVWISSICDPYQPLERKYKLTKACLEILLKYNWPIIIQTKSDLVLRDIDLLKEFKEVEVGITITTASENIRKIFEPNAPSIKERIGTLKKLHKEGIKTFVMIAPILPKVENLIEKLEGKVDYVIIDRMNYHYADGIYKKYKLEYAMANKFFIQIKNKLTREFKKRKIPCEVIF
jgi:DNA repair photolyase